MIEPVDLPPPSLPSSLSLLLTQLRTFLWK